jgi:hypothetical protein
MVQMKFCGIVDALWLYKNQPNCAFLWVMPKPKTATKTPHGGRRVGAGRPKANGRVLLTVRVNRSIWQWLETSVKQRRASGERNLTRTELVEEILQAEMVRQQSPKKGSHA